MYLGKDTAKESFQKLIEIISSKNVLDDVSLEKEIDVLCLYFGIDSLPDIQIQRKENDPIKQWFMKNLSILTGQI